MNAWLEQAWQFLSHPLVLPLTITGLAGLLAFVTSRAAPGVGRVLSIVASAAALVLGIRLFLGASVSLDVTWLELDGFALRIAMGTHTFGALVAAGSAFFGLLIAIYAQASERRQRDEGRFHALLCWSVMGAMGAAYATDLLWLLICWEVVSLCLYLLLNLGRGESASGAAKTFGLIGLGDAAMLLAIALVGVTQGTFRIADLHIEVDTPWMYFCYLLFVAAALAKAGAIPLHSWIPAAASDASAATYALLPASIDKLLGIYLLATFSLQVFVLDAWMRGVLMIIGAVTVLAAVFMATLQHRLKRLLSFCAVSQVGYMVLGIGTGIPLGIVGGVFHMLNHAVYKACLFLTAGAIERTGGSDELDRLGGLARVIPGVFVCFGIATLAISGVPPLNGFVSKWLVYQGCLADGSPLAMVCLVATVFGGALTLASFVKVLTGVFWGPVPHTPTPPTGAARFATLLPMGVLALLCIAFGVAASWPLKRLVLPALTDMGVDPAMTLTPTAVETEALGLWAPVPATILILLGLLGGLLLYGLGRVASVRVTNSFIGGEDPAETPGLKCAAANFYTTVEEMPGLGVALRDGKQSAFDVYRLGGQYGGTLVQLLRRQHTGVLSLYVSWCLVGGVVIVVYLMTVL